MNTLQEWQTPETVKTLIEQGDGKGIKIAVIDSGIEIAHPSLENHSLADDLYFSTERMGSDQARKCVVSENQGFDLFGHGTAVASIAWEMAPQVHIGSFRVFGAEGTSKTDIIGEAALAAINLGYHIINCSLGCDRADHLPKFKRWIDAAYLKGAHVVAAGNRNNLRRTVWPAYFPTVVAAHTTQELEQTAFSYSSGEMVEFHANGSNLTVPWKNGEFKKMSGTSYAAPRLAGILARILSVKPDLHPLEAKAMLIHLAERK